MSAKLAQLCLGVALGLASISSVDAEELGTPAVSAVTTPRDGYPDIAPDGKRIAFQSNRSGTWQLWLVDPDGSDLTRLTHGGANDVTPVWSPDGTKILFASDRAAEGGETADPRETFRSRDIFVMDLKKGEGRPMVTRLTVDPADEMHPEWAAGGRLIVFNRVYPSGDGADIVIMNADGSDERVMETSRGWNTYAGMTPDGSRIVYRGTLVEGSGDDATQNSDIFSAASDGSSRRRLTEDPAFDGWPAISPDGGTIAFASNRSGTGYHIHLMPVDGGSVRQITSGEDFNYTQPAWSADGRWLAAFRWKEDEAGEIGHIVSLDLPDE